MSFLVWIVAVYLLIIALIDIKYKEIYSTLLTGGIFFVAFLSIANNPNALNFGVLGLIMALLLFESGFFNGLGDIKVMILISFMVSSYVNLGFFIALVLIYGMAWKLMILMKIRKEKQVAFLPVFFFCYLSLMILRGLF